jgi:uncharacterized membrane protein YjdF
MSHLLIAAVTSVAIIVIAVVAKVPTYRVAPAFLLPAVWALYVLRRRLNLRPIHFALLASALLLHMLGAFGFYQQWPGPFSFDILVHYWFALVVTLAVHRTLVGNWWLRPWQAMVLSFFISMGLAAMHEIMEYCSYLLLGEQRGMLRPSTSYFFDTQRDLTNNLLGTLTALAAVTIARPFVGRRPHSRTRMR